MRERFKEHPLDFIRDDNDETSARQSLARLALEYLSTKEAITGFHPEEELIFFSELYGICPSGRHQCLHLKNDPELLRRVEKFIKRTSKPNRRTPILRHIHEYNFVEIYLNRLRLKDDIPKEIFKCVNLRVLCLNGNYLRAISPNIGRLKKLEILQLTDNLLTTYSIPYSLSFCQNLHTLHLDDNKMVVLPGFLLRMKNLRTLRRLNTKYTVREILNRTAMLQRTFKFFRIRKLLCPMYQEQAVNKTVSRLETLATRRIIVSKIDYFSIDGLPTYSQEIITKQYLNYFICDNCDNPIAEDYGFEVSTYRYGHLGNHWSIFIHRACNKLCAERVDELAYIMEKRTREEIDKKYSRYIQTYVGESSHQGNNVQRCCTLS